MRILLQGGKVLAQGSLVARDVSIEDGIISFIPKQPPQQIINVNNMVILSGFVDVHTHLRQPGFSYKETIFSATTAAAAGGYVAVCAMPNLLPPPDCLDNLMQQLDVIRKDAVIPVFPYGCITKGQRGEQLADFDALAPYVAGFSDDGVGVQRNSVMYCAQLNAARLHKRIVAHCEQDDLKGGAHIHDGAYARKLGIKGISAQSEYAQIARDLELVAKSGVAYHICHVSCAESVQLIRQAKRDGLAVTCETAPHYLLLCEDDLIDSGNFKMNPPLRTRADRDALISALADGVIDCIATDHAPHSKEEKGRGLLGSLNGVSGLDCAFAVLYTGLVANNIISLSRLMQCLSDFPAAFIGQDYSVRQGNLANLAVVDLNEHYVVNGANFLSMGKSTPFEGRSVQGRVRYTFSNGRLVTYFNTHRQISELYSPHKEGV